MIQIPTTYLNDGTEIPMIGLGTATLNGFRGVNAIKSAINNGYRLLDTAYNYENEGAVGKGIKESSVSRKDLFITSKLPGRAHQRDRAIQTIQESLYRADLDYYDLYLIHWPNPKQDVYVEAWQALLDAKKWGLIRSVGVCNFLPEHLERLKKETGVLPSVNQIELHPYFNQADQRQWHEENGVMTQSWSPLALANKLFEEPVIKKLADKYGRTAAQIVLRWHYQLNSISIPRSSNPKRQLNNLAIFDFELEAGDVELINSLNKSDGRLNDLDPLKHEEF
ncbi:aldo/keto reductase [Amphibacillus indicireducens]|uniref:Aldo/keto reductase n=1 Tax=Amphibacillus indicireducens TaxID=1076330 RepID=A0ABP7VUH3_9BACI